MTDPSGQDAAAAIGRRADPSEARTREHAPTLDGTLVR